ncbi:hypothetical protein GCM10020256_59730 [Streptomyces thermocoprophilus]
MYAAPGSASISSAAARARAGPRPLPSGGGFAVAGDGADLVVVVEDPGDGGAGAGDVLDGLGDDLAEGVGVPGGAEQVEEERLVEFVGADVAGVLAGGGHGDLADEEPFAAVALGVLLAYRAPAPPHVVDLGLVPGERVDRVAGAGVGLGVVGVGQLGVLVQAGGDVDAEAVDAPVEPEPQDAFELGGDLGGAPVPVGLLGGEHVQVPLAGPAVGLGDPGPCRSAEHRVPVVGRLAAVGAAAVGEVEAGAGGAAGLAVQGLTEPRVLAGAVVGDNVQQDLDAEAAGLRHEQVELGEVAEDRVDVAVVGDVVAVVVLR